MEDLQKNEDFFMENFIRSLNNLSKTEKVELIEIRKLMNEINDICSSKKIKIVLNALDLLREFYLSQTKTQ